MAVTAVVVAAGRSTRVGGEVPKQFQRLDRETIVVHAARALGRSPEVGSIVVVLPPSEIGGAHDADLRAVPRVSGVVAGGNTRMDSALAGVEAAAADLVIVHDAARPFVLPATIHAVVEATRRHGAAIPVLPASDTIKRDDGHGFVGETIDRSALRLAQTPQGAKRDWLLAALREAKAVGYDATDEAAALERAGRRVALVPGDPGNVKITTAEDLRRASGSFGGGEMRVGHGYDVHRFGGSRPLVLGGVIFPGEPGLAGHSDADVVLHAAMDAVLGAAGLRDIGHHFPTDDPGFAGADSVALARLVLERVRGAGLRIDNVDVTLLAERPKIAPRVEEMRAAVAGALGIDAVRVGIKATTLEGLGALGRREGIACHAVALLRRGDRFP